MSKGQTLRSRAAAQPLLFALAATIVAAPAAAHAQPFHLEGLRTEYHVNPVGIDVRAPRLSWKLHAERRATQVGHGVLRCVKIVRSTASAISR